MLKKIIFYFVCCGLFFNSFTQEKKQQKINSQIARLKINILANECIKFSALAIPATSLMILAEYAWKGKISKPTFFLEKLIGFNFVAIPLAFAIGFFLESKNMEFNEQIKDLQEELS